MMVTKSLLASQRGLQTDLTVALARSRTFDVIAHNHICSDGDDPRPIARELGASYLIICGLRRASDRVRLTVRLIDSSIGLYIWAQSYTQGLIRTPSQHKSRLPPSRAFMPRKPSG